MKEPEIKILLEQIKVILERHHVQPWAREFALMENQFIESQHSSDDGKKMAALERIRGIFGGMGSFNDVSIDPRAGYLIKPEEMPSVNIELSRLSTQLYELVGAEISRIARNDSVKHN